MNLSFPTFIERLAKWGMEYFRRYYGPYRAFVVSAKDPDGRGRIQVECPRARLSDKNGIWVEPMMHGAGAGTGTFWPPTKGEAVWIFFDNGDPLRPLGYVGGWYGTAEVPGVLAPDPGQEPQKRGFVTPGGIKVVLDDSEDDPKVTIQLGGGNKLVIKKDEILVGSDDGDYEPIPRGTTLKQYLENHFHEHSMGPTGKPLLPFPDAALSSTTKTS